MGRAAVFAIFACVSASAQSFEVASIKMRQLPLHTIQGFSSSGPRVVYESWGVLGLIMEAYDVKRDLLSFASTPPDADTAYYDIVAKAAGEAPRTRAEFRRMLQALLAERFRLAVHWEGREMPVYALVVGKSGPKFRKTAEDTAYYYHGGVNGSNQTIDVRSATMEQLAREIESRFSIDRPVVDKTGLSGTYDLKLEATPDSRLLRDADSGGVGIFTAVQEQLGLKLEKQKAALQVLVVDRVEKPSEN